MKEALGPFETDRIFKKLNKDSEKEMTYPGIRIAIQQQLDQDFRDCININYKRIESVIPDNGAVKGINKRIIKVSLMREMKNNNNKPHLVELFKSLSRNIKLDKNVAQNVYTAEKFNQFISECLCLQSERIKKPSSFIEEIK